MLVIAVVMILVVGPKDLPGMLRTIGKTVGNLRRMASDFQRQFSDALKEADIDEVKKELTQSTSIENPLSDISKSADELLNSLDDESDNEGDAKEKFDKIQAEIAEGKAKKASAQAKPAKVTSVKKAPAKKTAPRKTTKTSSAVKKPASKTAPGKTSVKSPAKRRTSSKSKTMTGSKTA